jgi:16S rRNA (cytosine1402-N4)-methyltransferase
MTDDTPTPHQRRPRYHGTHPRAFHEKYKELNPEGYAEDIAKILARGDTPAGSHRPIMVAETLAVLAPMPGEVAIDATLGHGGHAQALLQAILPGGKLFGLDIDPVELPRTEARLRAAGFGPDVFQARAMNFAALPQLLAEEGVNGVDLILADLGVSSMQIDNPARGFTFKREGPLDLRMNPNKGQPAAKFLETVSEEKLVRLLQENADERFAESIAHELTVRRGELTTTTALAAAIRDALSTLPRTEREEAGDDPIRRTFQALRIAVNGEFSALDTLLGVLPYCLNAGGRVAILTFHSGEDRRVKGAFKEGQRSGLYAAIADEVVRATGEERYGNSRASSAKLRWARKA